MAERGAATRPTVYRDLFAEMFAWRLTMLGTAALGFLVTFLLLSHEIPAFKNVMLPLLGILPAYLFLTSLNVWWAAQSAAKLGRPPTPVSEPRARQLRATRLLQAACGLVFGVVIALWYVHSVSN